MKLLSLWVFIFVSVVLAKPTEDAEEMVDPSTINPLTQQKETMLDTDSQDLQTSDEDDVTMDKVNSADTMDFDLSLFPASSVFGTNVFHQLQESLRVIRDQLNSLWNMNGTTIMNMPNDYKNSTSQSKIINGTLVMVNETISKVLDPESGIQSVYHTKVISIFPHNDTDHSVQPQLSQQKINVETDMHLNHNKEAHSDIIAASTIETN